MRVITTMALALGLAIAATLASTSAIAMDNSALDQPGFRAHKATYGVVYRLPAEAVDTLNAKIMPTLQQRLVKLGLLEEARTFNLPHVTVVHLHSADPSTPEKMLKAMPKTPPVMTLTLKNFYNTEAAKGAGAPWWLDLGVIKSGQGYADMMSFNTAATAALTPLRDGPLPRCTGPVFAAMGDAAKALTRSVGVSGVNVMLDGQETASHNPHTTLVYSMTPYDARVQAEMKGVADELNKLLPAGIDTQFKELSIVEIGFMGNVIREFYRIDLKDGSAWDTTSGKTVTIGK